MEPAKDPTVALPKLLAQVRETASKMSPGVCKDTMLRQASILQQVIDGKITRKQMVQQLCGEVNALIADINTKLTGSVPPDPLIGDPEQRPTMSKEAAVAATKDLLGKFMGKKVDK